MSKEAILTSAKSALKQNKLKDAARALGDPIKRKEADLVREYIAMQNANKGIVVESSGDLARDLSEILTKINAKNIIYARECEDFIAPVKEKFDMKPYENSVDSMRDELFSIDTSIVRARAGIADIGVIGIASSKDEPRLASLITQNCIAILEKKDIVARLLDGVEKLKSTAENKPSNMILISGPSRTADIELHTVIGVHGSQVVYIILV